MAAFPLLGSVSGVPILLPDEASGRISTNLLTRILSVRHLPPQNSPYLGFIRVIESPANERLSVAPTPQIESSIRSGRAVDPSPVQEWLETLSSAMKRLDESLLRELFLNDGYWRDHLALTWDFRTFGGPGLIASELVKAIGRRRVSHVLAEEGACKIFEHRTRGMTAESSFVFETDIATCRGHVRLRQDSDSGQGRAGTFFTSLEELTGFEERAGARRPRLSKSHASVKHSAGAQYNGEIDPQVL